VECCPVCFQDQPEHAANPNDQVDAVDSGHYVVEAEEQLDLAGIQAVLGYIVFQLLTEVRPWEKPFLTIRLVFKTLDDHERRAKQGC
jgi:hypothetical protein